MKRAFLVGLAIATVWMTIVPASAQRPSMRCIRLDHCIQNSADTYSRCKRPGPFVSPESVCRKALLNTVQQCHARYGFCNR